jgi:hypothetical protein
MELAKQNDFPTFSLHRRFKSAQTGVTEQFSPKPSPYNASTYDKRDRRARHVTD